MLNEDIVNDYQQLRAAFTNYKGGYRPWYPGRNVLSGIGFEAPGNRVSNLVGETASLALAPAWQLWRRSVGEKPFNYLSYYKKQRYASGDNEFGPPDKLAVSGDKVLVPRAGTKMPGNFRKKFVPLKRPKSVPKQVHAMMMKARKLALQKAGHSNVGRINYLPTFTQGGRGRGRRATGRALAPPAMPVPRTGYSQRAIPVAQARRMRLGPRMKARTLANGEIVRLPIRVWDSGVYAVYPNANDTTNFIVFGNNIVDCCNDYILAPWNVFYTPSLITTQCGTYSWFRFKKWALEFKTVMNYQNSGEILFLSLQDVCKLYNKGLTFACNYTTRSTMNGSQITVSDYLGQIATVGHWGTTQSVEANIKQFGEGHVVQISPYEKYTGFMASRQKWLRNSIPGAPTAGNNSPFDFLQWTEVEANLCVGGVFCMWGTLNDGLTFTSANTFRKVGDFYLNALVEAKGTGVPDITKDVDTSVRSVPSRLLRDEKFIDDLSRKLYACGIKPPKDFQGIAVSEPGDDKHDIPDVGKLVGTKPSFQEYVEFVARKPVSELKQSQIDSLERNWRDHFRADSPDSFVETGSVKLPAPTKKSTSNK